jgi:hypothetical protein
MPPLGGLATAGVITGISAGIKGISALHQAHKAKKMQVNRPTYQIPQEILNNQAMYKNLANSSRLPGQSNIENQIGANSANSINAAMQGAGSSADVLASLGNTQNNTNNALNNLAIEGAQNQNMNRDKLAGANESLAQYRDQAFDYNKNEPYQQAYARKMALQTAANANLQNGLQDVSNFSGALVASKGSGSDYDPGYGYGQAAATSDSRKRRVY